MSVRLAGRYINLMEIERVGGMDHGYVSYILQGKRVPSVAYAQRLAKCLGMFDAAGEPDINSLFRAIQDRKEELDATYRKKLA